MTMVLCCALLVWSYLSSPFTFSNPPTNLNLPPSPHLLFLTPSSSFIPMGSLSKNGFNLDSDDPSDDRKRRLSSASCSKRGAGGAAPTSCQVDGCPAVLTEAKRYHRRHKVCEFHAKAAVVVVSGVRQRFCQQCSRFHELSEFDEAKRSCRRRLAGHNERRRKGSSSEPQAPDAAYKQFQIA